MNKILRDYILKKGFYLIHKKPFIYKTRFRNDKIKFYINSYHSLLHSTGFKGFEPLTQQWMDTFFDTDDTVYDIGANIGIFTLHAAKRNVNVYSFEPSYQNYFTLNKNIIINNLSNALAYCTPVYNTTKYGILQIEDTGSGGYSTFDAKVKMFEHRQGSIGFSVDDIVKNIPFPNHIKIDVDGNEIDVVQGMINTIKNQELKTVLIELHNDHVNNEQMKQILSIFNDEGFEFWGASEGTEDNHIFIRE